VLLLVISVEQSIDGIANKHKDFVRFQLHHFFQRFHVCPTQIVPNNIHTRIFQDSKQEFAEIQNTANFG